MSGVLSGMSILEWAAWHQAPAAASMMADLGADVIKIEDRIGGDPFRGAETMYGTSLSVSGVNTAFEIVNRNKRSITLDLKKEEGKHIMHTLVKKCDAFITNYSPATALKLGADYDTLRQLNPALVYSVSSGLGLKGPDSGRRSFDTIAQARSGIMYMISDRDHTEPYQIVGGVMDQAGAVLMAYATVCALLARERTGKGQMVDVSLLSSAMNLQVTNIGSSLISGRVRARHSRTRAKNPLSNQYRCADGKWIMLAAFQSDRFWRGFCTAVDRPDLADDPRFDSLRTRSDNCRELIAILDSVFAARSRDAWLLLFQERCPELPYGPIQEISDLGTDPQVLENGYITEVDHPALGRVNMVNCPVTFTETPAAPILPAPAFGQHTEEVLQELCGYTWDDITRLKDEGVI